MAKLDEIKNKIKNSIKVKDKEVLENIDKEIDILEITTSLDSRTNLESFYDIWQNNKDSVGSSNEINSWLAYGLGLTTCKPDGEFLPERRAFARAGFPDVDMDFEYFRRQEVYNYIIEKYGRENVSNIGTYAGLKMKSAIRRIGKALDIADAYHKGKQEYVTENEAKVSEIIESLPLQMGAVLKVKDDEGNEKIIKKISEAYEHCPAFRDYLDKYPEILDHSKNIEGLLSIYGVHPAGIVVSDTPLKDIAPLRKAKQDDYSTQYAYEYLEQIGLIKIDILALSTLTIIKEILDLIEQNYGIRLDYKNFPLDDKKTLELYRSGRLDGVFQCETRSMQKVMKEIQVDSFDDVVAAIALFRPGPMVSIPEYCARKNGEKPIDYFHPTVEPYVKPYLESTLGVICYQEQIMQICNSLAGFSISDGYVMIKAIGKKKKHLMQMFEKQFISGCVKNGVPANVAKEYWDKYITPFAGYGFNKSHSLCYAVLSHQTAYLKANYPDEFFCASLSVESKRRKQDKVDKILSDAKKFGIKILEPDINKCMINYLTIKKKDESQGITQTEILPSLMVKGLGEETCQNIIDSRPIENLRDFAFKTDNKYVNKETVACLIDGGFFDKSYKSTKKKNSKLSFESFKEMVLDKFTQLRNDKRAVSSRGVNSTDLFG